MAIYEKPDLIPVVFQRTFPIPSLDTPSAALNLDHEEFKTHSLALQSHVFVLVHGFQGNANDMKTIRNVLVMQYPGAHFLCSVENENNTDGSIMDQGYKLADEVRKFLKRTFKNPLTVARISFIGHSLGGVIIRAALEHLHEFKNQMHTFLTLSSPHLGFLYANSALVNTGLWVLKKWTDSVCLSQLMFTDSKTLKDSALYLLSEQEVLAPFTLQGLSWFKNVVLLSSPSDNYSPYESSLMEVGTEASADQVYESSNAMAT
jgi:hypothetical protein